MSRPSRFTRTVLTEEGGISYYMSYGTKDFNVTAQLRYGPHLFEGSSLYLIEGTTSTELDASVLNELIRSELRGNVMAPQVWHEIYSAYKEEKGRRSIVEE